MFEFFIPFLLGVVLGCLVGVLFRDTLHLYWKIYISVVVGVVLFGLGYVVRGL
jgi:hypothetical protein